MTTHSLKSKTKSQKDLANASKGYQAAKFEADALLKALDMDSIDSSSEDDTPELQASLTQSSIAETDNVFTIENQTESVGKRIKQEAVNIHNEYVKGVNTGVEAKLVTDLGLSSILDLTHEEDVGTFTALKYISKLQSLESTSEANFIYIEIFRHVALTLHEDANLINRITENNGFISEQDIYTLWLPIIKRFVSIKKIIRTKQGEAINLFTTKRKQTQYFDHEKVKGFKIDLRLLLDYDRNEIDLCAGEVAINTYDSNKLIHDRSKSIRESKEICDHRIEAGLGRDSIHLFREGPFVCQDMFRFPQNIKELPEFIHIINGLEYLIECNQIEANELIEIYDKIYRFYNPSLNSEPNTSINRNKPVIPPQLFCKGKRRLFHERVIIEKDSPEAVMSEMKGAEDMFGWVEMDDNTWYDSVTSEKSDVSPYR
ncbi:hypothetical protein INT48_003462 [Thamnidium elegans]|uniref:Uncharacterized protein n=1 Tax=Thamnidium elegans TaxID=101142 RepID=A0A8H7SMJ6_9FUNG|nr:hypothetical protein INT48_003462 [Thamnidium elegans]